MKEKCLLTIIIVYSLIYAFILPFHVHATDSWYNTSWQYRKKLIFDNSAQSENLTNFPVLVKLTSDRFDFTLAQSAGQDIRFTDSDGITLLPYEIESYDSSSSTANIWVKVPQVDASSSTDYIYMYYGNSSTTDGQSGTGVWDSNYQLVYHMKDTSSTITDSTSNGINASKRSTMEPNYTSSGQMNGAQSFDGVNDHFTLSTSTGTELDSTTMSISFWFKPTAKLGVVSWENGSNRCNIREEEGTGTGLQFETGGASRPLTTYPSLNSWHYIVATKDGSTASLYVDGTLADADPATTKCGAGVTLSVGQMGGAFKDAIDEYRISNITRSAAYIAASYKSESDTFISSYDTGQAADSTNLSENKTNTTTTIEWTTTHGGTTQIEYGTTTDYGSTTDAISISEGTNNNSTTITLSTCTEYHYRIKNITHSAVTSYGADKTFNSGGCPVVSSSVDSNTPQIAQSSGGGGGVFSPAIEDTNAHQTIRTIIEPNTFDFDGYLSANAVNTTSLLQSLSLKLGSNNGNVLGVVSNNHTSPRLRGASNTILAGGSILGIKTNKNIYWQIGRIEELWYKDHYNKARILPSIQRKPSIVALSYTESDLIIAGNPKKKFNEKLLQLAFSSDGKYWTILPTSVVDVVNNTVAALHKVGGYYMVVGR